MSIKDDPGDPPKCWIPILQKFGEELDWPKANREFYKFLMVDFDVDQQYQAIESHLQLTRQARDSAGKIYLDSLDEHSTDDAWSLADDFIYTDATYSMAAIGMLGPFVESIFYQSFLAINNRFSSANHFSKHSRWKDSVNHVWDCHYKITPSGPSKNLLQGIMQMSEATGLNEFLPRESESTLEALILYRNKMFHNGLEWSRAERSKFEATIQQKKFDQWFYQASIGRMPKIPWIFYMTDEFIQHCLEFSKQLIEAFGLLTKKMYLEEIRSVENSAEPD